MVYGIAANDMVIKGVKQILDKCSQKLDIEILSIVLYGSKARGDRSSQSDYEIMVLVRNDTPMSDYIKFNELLKIELLKEKLFQVKCVTYTPDIFEDTMYNDDLIGTFLYMICKENIVLFDRVGTFTAIKERLSKNDKKDEEAFLNQCIEFSKMMGSEKWERKWEKTLLQYKYMKRRKTI